MELGIRTRSTAAVLSSIAADLEVRRAALIREWKAIVEWGHANVVDTVEGAAMIGEGSYLDTGVPIAGDGAPLVSEFALMELIAVLGRTPDGGRAYVGRVLGCAWRMPETYRQVVAGRWSPGALNALLTSPPRCRSRLRRMSITSSRSRSGT